ncbi:MAG TPA: LysM peptidoglycan-binding domain-containing protein, partial [Sorangium sp.]|nr:LysM peptidoglycan-binding domain-containing protein [Sorangium sp.]
NLDVKRTWALVRALVTDTDVEYIFINSSIQKLLKEYALASGEDRSWLDSLFQYRSKHAWPIIRHVHGHDTHLHVRFYNRVAQQLGVRAHRWLARRGIVKPYTRYLRHRARRGDLLGNLAKRYGTTVAAIQKINHLRNNRIRAGRTYLIPKKVKRRIRKPPPLSIPPRRLPPPRPAKTAASGGQRQRRAAR